MAETGKPAGPPPPPPPSATNYFAIDVGLRVVLFAATIVALVVMVNSNQTELPLLPGGFRVPRTAKFNHSPAFVYFVAAMSVACLYSILTTLASLGVISKPAHATKFLLHFAFWDVLMLGIVASATGAAAAVAYSLVWKRSFNMKQADGNMQSFIPVDVALKIVSNLEALDLCALGSCSRFWRELCGSNCLWESLARKRWPLLISLNDSSFSFFSSSDPIVKGWKEVSARILQEKGWRELYVRVHREMADRATAVVELLEQSFPSESLEIGVYYEAIEDLHSMQFAFKDVEMFLFKPKLNVLLNLVGLHYSIICLRVPAVNVMNALLSCKISERQVCVKWWKLGRLFYGIRMRDESHYRWVSLADLAPFMRCYVLRSPFLILHTLNGLFRAHRGNIRSSVIMCLGA